VLFPEAALRSRPERFKLAVANAAGEFLIRGIAPGAYSVLAFEQIEDGAYQDAGFLQQFVATATKITVAPSTEVTASLLLLLLAVVQTANAQTGSIEGHVFDVSHLATDQ
jgi:hypothetical protein